MSRSWKVLAAATLVAVAGCAGSLTTGSARTTGSAGTTVVGGSVVGCSVVGGSVVGGSDFVLTSPTMVDGGTLPVQYTCDGDSSSPPLAWRGAPAGTVGYAVAMHHVPGPGDTHWYWVLYDIAPTVDHLDAAAVPSGVKVGTNSVNANTEYAPPCSKGPGAKVYTFTVYALSAVPDLPDPTLVTRDVMLAAIRGTVLAAAHIDVTYDRTGLTS